MFEHPDELWNVAFSPHGRVLATSSLDGTARLWDLTTMKPVATLGGHTHYVYSVVFSPDGRVLATGSQDGTVRLWDMATSRLITVLKGHTDAADPVFSPDGRTLVTTSRDEIVRLWDTRTMKRAATLGDHTGPIMCVRFAPDGATLATSSSDGTARLWDTATGRSIARFTCPFPDQSPLIFTSDGELLAVHSDQERVWLRNMSREKTLATFQGQGCQLFAKDSPAHGLADVVVRAPTGSVRAWNIPLVSPEERLVVHHQPDVVFQTPAGDYRQVAIGWDGEILAVGAMHGPEPHGEVDPTVWLGDARGERVLPPLVGHVGRVRAVAFSPRQTVVATCGTDKTARLWRISRRPQ
ncbi:WD40 repeat domain-containing protein [Spongiactinospora sp. TRM90649]|uniref:WD40 repeat domain-containing protein n=1 Tax=Spongiactinospora sp. TRM90649 TaxID=3031114 RepID=UPI0023F79693|nr:WD40 repeat domain-containing protein [Spongiactinospora sp. TRM90649]MDF5756053.1 WD40 repeat domain-containing protein [Spongiactinospora sp. TRM90649]